MANSWKGFLFDNPDKEANRNLLERCFIGKEVGMFEPGLPVQGGWGSVVTTDEIRYSWMIGNSRLMSTDGSYITNENLQGLIHRLTLALSNELEHDIYPQVYRHRPKGNLPRFIEDHAKWFDPIDYKNDDVGNNFFVSLGKAPLNRVLRWEFVNPVSRSSDNVPDGMSIDLLSKSRIIYESGILRSVGMLGNGFNFNPNAAIRSQRVFAGLPQTRVPTVHYIDFISGYDSAARVPAELCEVIGILACLRVMSAHGESKAGAIASYSVGVGPLHESISTTQSATSSLFGARQLELYNRLKAIGPGIIERYKPKRLVIL
ncbi:hypothetical protein LEP1GSC111_1242 [Leptospira interrogans str. UT126]|uniref:hypothetical protein n=1 Tax=Leptospira interrogans TaxID=173 RepID=UPI0002BEE521|nr:hypothetical protein [Leptospira interrogans]EMJ56515.1 hypothetical protein LEP1GSC111_1242 [Leptospira interrogans str. UT126]